MSGNILLTGKERPMQKQKQSENQPDDKAICEIDFSSDSGFKELKSLIKDSRFVCRNCGRAAGNEESLCEPEWIY
jgi:hypothetical protein